MSKNKKKRPAIPAKNPASTDVVMTPDYLAREIVEYFQPRGAILDPCRGDGAFYQAIRAFCWNKQVRAEVEWCELPERDFYEYSHRANWIISNPPYSILRPFLQHSYKVADNIVYLVQQPRPFFKAIVEDADKAGFGLKEIYRVKTPQEWRKLVKPNGKKFSPFGGGYCAAHWQRGWDHRRHGTLVTGTN